jgi:hypothetical protein
VHLLSLLNDFLALAVSEFVLKPLDVLCKQIIRIVALFFCAIQFCVYNVMHIIIVKSDLIILFHGG